MEATLASWTKNENPDKKILEDLKALRESRSLVEVLSRILMFLGKLDEVIIRPLLRSINRNIESVPMDGDRPEQDFQFKLILFLLNERVSNDEKQNAAEAAERDIGAIDVAVRVVNALTRDESSRTWYLRRSLDVSRIMGIVQGRFAKEFIDAGTDIFASNALPLYVLCQIATYNSESAEMVNRYAIELLEREPKHIGKLIDGFLIEFPGGPNGFNFEQLKSAYDIKRLVDLAVMAGEHAWVNEEQKRAIETFLRLAATLGRDEALGQNSEE